MPILPNGFSSSSSLPAVSSTAFIIFVANGPQASVFTVTPRGPSSSARVRLRWCRPALLALYAKFGRLGTARAFTLPILTTRDGSEGREARSRSGVRSWVRVKTRWRLRVRSFVQAASGCVSKDSPQEAPELLMRMCRPLGSSLVRVAARALHASRDWMSAGREKAVPPEALPVVC